MKPNSNKKKYIKIAIIALVVIVIIIISTTSYAIWQNYVKQTSREALISSCLEMSYTNEANDINIDEMYPMTDVEGSNLTPYSFSITNNCNEYIFYDLGLESIGVGEEASYIADNYVKIKYDDRAAVLFSDLTSFDNDTTVDYTIRSTKGLDEYRYIGPHQTNNHTVRMFLDEDTPASEMDKVFRTKVRLMAFQVVQENKIQPRDESCFTVTNEGVLTAYDKDTCGKNLVIPDSVNGVQITSIASGIVIGSDLTGLNMVNMYGLTEIGDSPFGTTTSNSYAGGNTRRFIIPYGVTSIGNSAFRRLTNTQGSQLIMPDTLRTIGNYAFYSFAGNYVQLNPGLQSIGTYAFNNYVGTGADLIIPNSVTSLGDRAFIKFNGNKLVLSNNIPSIGVSTFSKFVGTGSDLVIPNSVTTLGNSAFVAFNGKSLTLSNNLTTIGTSVFAAYEGIGTDLVIPGGIATISANAFKAYKGNSLTINEGVTTINASAFAAYNGSNVVLPSTINTVRASAFGSMDNTKTIIINKPNTSGMTLASGWNGQAQIKCMSNGSIINCP